jgi:hypothetical protein
MALKRLALVAVPKPCDVPWDGMTGAEASRRCEQCDREVYNFGAMTTAEAERLLADSEGRRLCATFTRGPDGQPITSDRPARFLHGPRFTVSRAAATAVLTVSLTGGVTALRPDGIALAQAAAPQTPSTPRGGLRGSVHIYGGWAAEGAEIHARDQKTGEKFATEAAKDGSYQLSLPKGRYDVSISFPLHSSCHVEGVDIAGRLLTADALLYTPARGEVVTVKKSDGCYNKKTSRLGHKK